MMAGVRRKITQELNIRKHVRRITLVTAKVAIPLIVVGQLLWLICLEVALVVQGVPQSLVLI